jgi:hypothetical protein
LGDAGGDAVEGAGLVSFQVELVFEGVVDGFDELADGFDQVGAGSWSSVAVGERKQAGAAGGFELGWRCSPGRLVSTDLERLRLK